jgi:uncharacterized protein DUF6941
MKTTTALLCDFAQLRESLLFISSGGVTRIYRDEWPAPMGVHLALVFQLHRWEADQPHELRVVVQGADGGRVAEVTGGFQLGKGVEDFPVGKDINVSVAMPLTQVGLPGPGQYSIEILVDAQHQQSLRFTAEKPPSR